MKFWDTRRGTKKLSPAAMISIIDDDEFMLDAVNNLVRSLGYKAAVFSSARIISALNTSEIQHV
jgi:FixJ family two-component response regulator